ncbi:MAG TPA: polysaccharide biosynthesis/export family protein [Pyrinomonadaceae bacterium]|jgi:protein involved in polysaccharide export with SLBB domain|nr:polysaccharide biosynthesis/export family protein [Pyrinomonadaceae bacterium]
MKKYLFAAAFAAALCAPCARASGSQSNGVRVGPAAEEKAEGDSASTAEPKKDEKKPSPARESSTRDAKSAQPNSRTGEAASAVTPTPTAAAPSTSDAPAKPGANAPVPVNTPAKPASDNKSNDGKPSGASDAKSGANSPNTSSTNGSTPAVSTSAPAVSAPAAAPLTTVYRIGVGDVLDIRTLNDTSTRQSTLFTVGAGGVLDHPYLRDPLTIAGMTTDELAAQLVAEFRHRGIYEKPQVRVSVREYASHAVLVSGLAGDPGTKILRREAIPLYVVIAEAQPKPEAGRAVIISHSTGKVTSVDLNDAAALNTLVQAGDVISLTVRPPEFFYIGGEISSPGQKDFHSGMTLTQAVMAAGGATALAGERVKVLRAGADGRLVAAEYSLREIEGGVVPDPVLQAGDRIEVARAGKPRK